MYKLSFARALSLLIQINVLLSSISSAYAFFQPDSIPNLSSVVYDTANHANGIIIPFSTTNETNQLIFQMSTDENDTTTNSSIFIKGVASEPIIGLNINDFQVTNGQITSLSVAEPSGVWEPTYFKTLGADLENQGDYIGNPTGLAFNSQGHLYVASFKANRVKIYDKEFNYLGSIGNGSYGSGEYQFDGITEVHIDTLGQIYIADVGNHRVQIFNAAHEYVATIGTTGVNGDSNSEFNSPGAIATDSQGRIYVADRSNYRVQIFDSNYQYVATIGTTGVKGAENDQFGYPAAIAIDTNGQFYVVDTHNHRVQIFSSDLEYFATIGTTGSTGSGDNQFNHPEGIAFDSLGSIYVADRWNRRVQVFNQNRQYQSTIDLQSMLAYNLPAIGNVSLIALDNRDQIYLADRQYIHVLDQDQVRTTSFGSNGSGQGEGQFYETQSLFIDQQHKLYVTERLNYRIQVFDQELNHLVTLQGDRYGIAEDNFQNPYDVAVDELGNIYVTDAYQARVQIFDKDYNYVGRIGDGTIGTGNHQLANPYAITIDQEGNIYVVDRHNHRVQIFDKDRKYVATIGSGIQGSANDQFDYPYDVAVDQQRNIYVADPLNFRVQIFDANRQYKATLGKAEVDPRDNLFLQPENVTIDQYGNLLVLDRARSQIKAFDSELNQIYTYGTGRGIGKTQFEQPSDIVVGDDGIVYIADQRNHRVQLLASSTHYQIILKPLADGLVTVQLPADAVKNANGNGNEETNFNITYMGPRPSVQITSTEKDTTTLQSFPIAITFSEKVTGFEAADLIISNSTLTTLVTQDSISFHGEINTAEVGSIQIEVPAAIAYDQVGLTNIAATPFVIEYQLTETHSESEEQEEPLTASLATALDTVQTEFIVTVVFNQEVTDLTKNYFTVANGQIISMETSDSISFNLLVMPNELGNVQIGLVESLVQTDPLAVYFQQEKEVVTGIINNQEDLKLKLYPVPTEDAITIESSLLQSGNFIIKIMTMDGRILSQRQYFRPTQQQLLHLSYLISGRYLIIVSSEGHTVAREILKE